MPPDAHRICSFTAPEACTQVNPDSLGLGGRHGPPPLIAEKYNFCRGTTDLVRALMRTDVVWDGEQSAEGWQERSYKPVVLPRYSPSSSGARQLGEGLSPAELPGPRAGPFGYHKQARISNKIKQLYLASSIQQYIKRWGPLLPRRYPLPATAAGNVSACCSPCPAAQASLNRLRSIAGTPDHIQMSMPERYRGTLRPRRPLAPASSAPASWSAAPRPLARLLVAARLPRRTHPTVAAPPGGAWAAAG
jgi:hypothetical protein